MIRTLFLSIGLLTTCTSFAQPKSWMIANDKGNRYEGVLTDQVGNSIIHLASFIAYREDYEFKKNQNLKVRYYSPQTSPFQIQSEELQVTHFYLMRAKHTQTPSGWQIFKEWPVDEVLRKLPVKPADLGVLVRLGKPGSREYLPAWVYHSNYPGSIQNYSATFRIGRSAASGNYKIYSGKGRSQAGLLKTYRISAKNSGTPFSLLIPLTLLKKEGWYFMEVNLYEKGTLDLSTYSFSFYHKP